jgi:hypothetical protein
MMRQRLKALILVGMMLGFPLTLGACKVEVNTGCLYIAYDWPFPTSSGFFGPGCK